MPAPATLLAAGVLATALPSELRWDVVNDTVMGGRSTGRAVDLDGGGVRFEGDLSLESNGGFASVRSAGARVPLDGAQGLRVTVLGDGRVWMLTLRRADVPIRGGSYRAAIETTAGEVTTHDLAWSDFAASSFGRPLPTAPPIAGGLDRIASIGLLLADKQPGPFALELQDVTRLSSAPERTGPADGAVDVGQRDRLKSSFAAALRQGVPAFNAGRVDVCAAHYRTALESALLLGGDGLSTGEADVLLAALQRADAQDPTEAAWTYRRAMDAVLVR